MSNPPPQPPPQPRHCVGITLTPNLLTHLVQNPNLHANSGENCIQRWTKMGYLEYDDIQRINDKAWEDEGGVEGGGSDCREGTTIVNAKGQEHVSPNSPNPPTKTALPSPKPLHPTLHHLTYSLHYVSPPPPTKKLPSSRMSSLLKTLESNTYTTMTSNLNLPTNNPSPLTPQNTTTTLSNELNSLTTVIATSFNAVIAPLTISLTLHYFLLPSLFPNLPSSTKLVVETIAGFAMLVVEVALWCIRTGMVEEEERKRGRRRRREEGGKEGNGREGKGRKERIGKIE